MKTSNDAPDLVELFLVLDFDGVLNMFPENFDAFKFPDSFTDYTFQKKIDVDNGLARVLEVNVSTELVSRLNVILEDPRVQLVWLTSWKYDVLPMVAKFGLKSYNPSIVIDYLDRWNDTHSIASKTLAFGDFFEDRVGTYSVVWVDDVVVPIVSGNLINSFISEDFDDSLAVDLDRLLMVASHEEAALSKNDVSIIENFVRGSLGGWGSDNPNFSSGMEYRASAERHLLELESIMANNQK